MKLQQIYTQILLCAMVFLTATPLTTVQQSAGPTPLPAANATVADLKGEVQVELPGRGDAVPTLGQVLPPETVVTTKDGTILLRLEDGSQILVHSKTRLVLKQPSPTGWQRLLLSLGKIRAEIQKRTGGSPPFQIGSPSAVISVRGTRFYVDVDKHNTTRVTVEEGEVDLESVKGKGKPVRIKAGFSSSVKEDSAPEPPHEAPGQGKSGDNPGKGWGNSPSAGPHGNPGGRGKKP